MALSRHDICIFLVLAICTGLLLLIPGPARLAAQSGFRARARVLEVDDSALQKHNLVWFGSQRLKVRILGGALKGQRFMAGNELRAQMELDKRFKPGDTAIVVMDKPTPDPGDVLIAQDHSRLGWTWVLFTCFCVLLCAFGGWTGFNALLSFIFSCLVIWKAVIPLVLRGWPASGTIFGSVVFLTAVIMYLVAGLNRRGVTAFLGATLGVLTGLLTAHLFTALLKINGATLPYAQTLLFSGYEFLDLGDVFAGAMILASSGAV
ncbi:MAG: YibE/F family protein, partial [Victivallales bacterium]|nr:YibE/F family protein [Victivallales bacterium]